MKSNVLTPWIPALALTLAVASCAGDSKKQETTLSGLNPDDFVSQVDGKTTGLYTLRNAAGMEACITNYGGRLVSLMVPDRDGQMRDVVLGFDSVAAYFPENNLTDFGASIGRYANRINKGRFVIDGDTVQLPVNNFGHTLHGGPAGWQYQVYDVAASTDSSLTLVMNAPDGENGFPGNLKATVTYTLTGDNALDIAYTATTDAPTVVNLTNHSYFNLNGDPTQPITDHLLYINADGYTPVDSTYMTTGEILPVAGTPMDFTAARPVGAEIDNFEFVQLKNGNGYDHNWVLNTQGNDSVVALRMMAPSTGITLEILTDEPGVQVYSGNFLDGTVTGKNGIIYAQRTGMALETQHYPDTPNKPQWPTAVLRPGETYTSHCVYRFSVDK